MSVPIKPIRPTKAARLQEIVAAIRDHNRMPRDEWIMRYPDVYELAKRGPIDPGLADRPVTQFVANLQCELQLRMAEVLADGHRGDGHRADSRAGGTTAGPG